MNLACRLRRRCSLVTVATLAIGTWGLRFSRTTSDFFVASRSVRPGLNASAISGEYLSAASFLGIAGLVLTFGAEMLWYPVGWTAGYLVLLVLVAAPLRRSGAYTLPDFAEARLDSRTVRTLASVMVVAIGWLYVMPQLQGAGVALRAATGLPGWAGGLRRRGRRTPQRAGGRDALDHLRPGVPVLAEADRAARCRSSSSSSCGSATADARRPTRACSSAASPAPPGPTRSTSRATTRSTRRTP